MKKLLATLLLFSLILAMFVMPAAADGENADTFDPYAENPTISTANDYINFFYEVYTNKTNYKGKTITLLKDITLNETSESNWYAKDDAVKLLPSKNGWSDFMGTLDGNGHTIKGVIVYGSEFRTDLGCGLFPYVTNASFKNLTIDGFYVCSTNTTALPVWGNAGIGGLIGSAYTNANGRITIENVTMRNGIVTAVDDGLGAMGALIGCYYGVNRVGADATMNVSIVNTRVEESVRLVKGNSKVEYEGGIFGYVEANYQSNPTVVDLSASKIQPNGSMSEDNPLGAIGKYRYKVADSDKLGATFTIKNDSTAYEQQFEMDGTGVVDYETTDDGGNFSYKDFTDDYNDMILESGCYGRSYQELQSFTVTWKVDGVTTTEVYPQGATPSYKGSTDKPMTDTKLYVFTGWDPELAPVTADVTYTAKYDEFDKVKVTWIVDGVETVEYYKKGEMPNYKGETLKEQDENAVYSFKGWDKEIVAANEDVTYTAVYDVKNKYKITWVVDGKETVETYLEGVKPSYKGKPTKAEDDEYTYKFIGWDKELVAASENVTYTAVFDKTAKNAGTSGEDKADEKGGCGSSISVGFVSLMVIGMAGAFAFRKKHD